EFGRHDPMSTDFQLSYVPAGFQISSVEYGPKTSYWLTGPYGSGSYTVADTPGETVDVTVVWVPGRRPVQGHRTEETRPKDGRVMSRAELLVNLRPGAWILIEGPGSDFTELYRIADGLILP